MRRPDLLNSAAKDAWGKFQKEIKAMMIDGEVYSDFSESYHGNLEGFDITIKFGCVDNSLTIQEPICQALRYEAIWAIINNHDVVLKELGNIINHHCMKEDAYMTTFRKYLNAQTEK